MSTYIVFDGIFEKPSVSAFQNFFWIENWLNIKKVMGKHVWMCFVLTALTYIALNALKILTPSVNSVDIYSITLYTVLCKSHKHQYQQC